MDLGIHIPQTDIHGFSRSSLFLSDLREQNIMLIPSKYNTTQLSEFDVVRICVLELTNSVSLFSNNVLKQGGHTHCAMATLRVQCRGLAHNVGKRLLI